MRSTAAPYTESRLTRSVANERVGFPVVEHKVCTQLRIFQKEIKSTLNQEPIHILGERGQLVTVIII